MAYPRPVDIAMAAGTILVVAALFTPALQVIAIGVNLGVILLVGYTRRRVHSTAPATRVCDSPPAGLSHGEVGGGRVEGGASDRVAQGPITKQERSLAQFLPHRPPPQHHSPGVHPAVMSREASQQARRRHRAARASGRRVDIPRPRLSKPPGHTQGLGEGRIEGPPAGLRPRRREDRRERTFRGRA